jgi:hypothetical protein
MQIMQHANAIPFDVGIYSLIKKSYVCAWRNVMENLYNLERKPRDRTGYHPYMIVVEPWILLEAFVAAFARKVCSALPCFR